jgi:uncharacterized protein YqiB (DUF1249 family)
MIGNLRDLFAEDISDETAYHIWNFLHGLAVGFESCHFEQIRRYCQSQIDLSNELMELMHKNSEQTIGITEESQDDIF